MLRLFAVVCRRRLNFMNTPWIKTTERHPETTGFSCDYLVRLSNGDKVVAAWMNIGGWDFDPGMDITHWMDLPEDPVD